MKNFNKMLLLLSLIILISSCNSGEAETQQIEEQIQIEEQQQVIGSSLNIIGDNVNVREQPSTSAKAMTKLQKGEAFDILDITDNYETIGIETDYWYRIEKNGKSVWVFGAFTSQNLNDNPQTVQAVYKGTEQGDYFHMTFSNAEKRIGYDFGEAFWSNSENAAANTFKQYGLEENEDKYEGKTFDITFKVVLQETYKGGGFMEGVIREVPVITNLELIK
jgi:hypothetical protein